MTAQEQRDIKAMALLEREEARAELALLRAKAARYRTLYQNAIYLLARSCRENASMELSAEDARKEVERLKDELIPVLQIEVLFSLDDDLAASVRRLKDAQKHCGALGFDR